MAKSLLKEEGKRNEYGTFKHQNKSPIYAPVRIERTSKTENLLITPLQILIKFHVGNFSTIYNVNTSGRCNLI